MKRFEPFNKPRKCPRCRKLHVTDDWFCEHCLASLLDDVPLCQTLFDPLK